MTWDGKPLLILVQAGMELSWLHACVAFVVFALVGRALPLAHALAVFAAAAITGHFSLGRGWRNYLVLAVQATTLAGAVTAVVYVAYYNSYALFSSEWIRLAVYGPHTKKQWAEIISLSFTVVAYWIGGTFLARRQMTYYAVCSRFDIGLAAFFCLFLMDLVIAIKGGPRIGGTLSLYSLFSFLLLALLGIGISRARPAASRSFLPGYGIAGIVASFSAIVLLSVGSVILFFLPTLRKTAEVGYLFLATGGNFIAPFAVAALRFLFGPRNTRPDLPSPSSRGVTGFDHVLNPTTWLGHLVENVMQWGMKAFFGVMLLFAAGLLLYVIVRWLLRKSGSGTEREKPRNGGEGWLSSLWHLLTSLRTRLMRRLQGYANAADYYRALLSWGRRSGLPTRPSDTPAEFGSRLSYAYPELRTGIDKVVDAFNRETYGDKHLTDHELVTARSSLGSLRNPRHWLKRLRTRLMRQGS
jgi:hypothetical protein